MHNFSRCISIVSKRERVSSKRDLVSTMRVLLFTNRVLLRNKLRATEI